MRTWGSSSTQFFFSLTPERILEAVESSGIRCSGRCLQLNSMENRVYELEIERDEPGKGEFRIAKFYRPGRWTREQILEEHQFLTQLSEYDIPVVAPLQLPSGETLGTTEDLFFALFPKQGGRIPDELDDEQLARVGRLIARLHGVGATSQAEHRIRLDPQTYGRENLAFLIEGEHLPAHLEESYETVVDQICDATESWFDEASYQRIHGDCHFGNILWGTEGPFLVDFDDMVRGPAVQDLWLVIPGRDEESKRQLDLLVTAYEGMREFDRSTLRLIEPLRALRMVHFSAWIAKRWEDKAFQQTFIEFGTEKYWQEELFALREQLGFIQGGGYVST